MRDLAQASVRAWAIDQNELVILFHFANCHRQTPIMDIFTLCQTGLVYIGQRKNIRRCQIQTMSLAESKPVFYIARKGSLPKIQIENPNFVPHTHQCRCDMHGNSRLSRATFFVSDNDNMRHLRDSLVRMVGHSRHNALGRQLPRNSCKGQ
jgi:hypothetical protein